MNVKSMYDLSSIYISMISMNEYLLNNNPYTELSTNHIHLLTLISDLK